MISRHRLVIDSRKSSSVDKVLTRAQSECQQKKGQQQFHCLRSADVKDCLQDWMRFRLRFLLPLTSLWF